MRNPIASHAFSYAGWSVTNYRHHPEAAMSNDSGYFRRQAAECAVRAEEASDREIQEFFVRMRRVWIAMADRFDTAASPDAQKAASEAAQLH
jgi:hypothetical protein